MQKYIEERGWLRIPSKNPYMISFLNDRKHRLNFYFTTNTLTIQSREDNINLTYRDIDTVEKLYGII